MSVLSPNVLKYTEGKQRIIFLESGTRSVSVMKNED